MTCRVPPAPVADNTAKTPMNDKSFPPGWDSERVQRLIAHYDALGEEQQVAEDEAAGQQPGQTTVVVPVEFMPAIREMLAHRTEARGPAGAVRQTGSTTAPPYTCRQCAV